MISSETGMHYNLGHWGVSGIFKKLFHSLFLRGNFSPQNYARLDLLHRLTIHLKARHYLVLAGAAVVNKPCPPLGGSQLRRDEAEITEAHRSPKGRDHHGKAREEKPRPGSKMHSGQECGLSGGSDGQESACNVGDLGSILGSGRSLGRGNGNQLQHSCLEIPWTEEPGGLQSMGSQRVGHN